MMANSPAERPINVRRIDVLPAPAPESPRASSKAALVQALDQVMPAGMMLHQSTRQQWSSPHTITQKLMLPESAFDPIFDGKTAQPLPYALVDVNRSQRQDFTGYGALNMIRNLWNRAPSEQAHGIMGALSVGAKATFFPRSMVMGPTHLNGTRLPLNGAPAADEGLDAKGNDILPTINGMEPYTHKEQFTHLGSRQPLPTTDAAQRRQHTKMMDLLDNSVAVYCDLVQRWQWRHAMRTSAHAPLVINVHPLIGHTLMQNGYTPEDAGERS